MRPNHITDPAFQQRFWSNMLRSPAGCLEWTGCQDSDGYGQVKISGQAQLVHRLAWTLQNGPIPDGLLCLHHCDNRVCCDVEHLFLGTHADNAHDRDAKGRAANLRGEQHGNAKLTDADVLIIRRIYVPRSHEFGQHALARRFGVDHALIGGIVRHETWTHV